MKRLERDRLIVWFALLPTPREDADPCERQGPHSGLMGLALVPLLLLVALCPEGMPDRLRCPLHARLPQELWTLETPVHPGFLAAAFGHRRDPGICLQGGGGPIPFTLFAAGDQEAGSEDGASAGQSLEEGEVGMAVGPLCAGGIELGDRLQGDTELGNEGLDEEGIGCNDPVIRGERGSRFDGLDTLCDDLWRAHVVVPEAGFKGSTTSKLHGLQGRPATQEVAEDQGVFVLKPVQPLGEIVLERTGETIGHPDFVTHHAATVFDELCQRTHRGALRCERVQLVAMGQQQVELEFGIGGIVFGPAGRESFTIPRQHERIDREEDEKVIRAQGGDQRPFVKFEADSKRVAMEPCA